MNLEDFEYSLFEGEFTEEKVLARKYIMSVQTNEDLHTQDQKYWDYHNHVMNLRKANGNLFDEVCKIHEKKRSLE